jgi:glycerophosphoryl diester phosphodiesterase
MTYQIYSRPTLRSGTALTFLMVAAAALAATTAHAEPLVEQILDRLINANQHRDHVMVVAHRGSWWKDGKIVLAENSLSAIDRAVSLGVEMVELDVQKTSDGKFIILHDVTLDRTTTCTGPVVEKTLAEVQKCNLIIEGTHEKTAETVPTLEQVFNSIRGRVLMNVDIKLGVEELANVVALGEQMGVERQLVIKNQTGTPQEVEAARATLERIRSKVVFMPILDDKKISDIKPIETAYATFKPEAVELLDRWQPGSPLTNDGGLNFSTQARALASSYDAHMWINTLFQGGVANLSGGRGDPIAVGPGLTDDGWGFWVRAGATIFQSDEPEALLQYLTSKGYRKPYLTQ